MADAFRGELQRFIRALEEMPRAVDAGGAKALDDIKDDWIRESRDVAPLDTSNLRNQISGEITNNDTLVVSANAVNRGRFNYAHYIHEQDAGGRQLRTSGTIKKFLDVPAEQRTNTWLDWIEEEVGEELRQKGVVVEWQR